MVLAEDQRYLASAGIRSAGGVDTASAGGNASGAAISKGADAGVPLTVGPRWEDVRVAAWLSEPDARDVADWDPKILANK
eukprot:6824215-Pyramimonas_sp.AAC.1